MVNLQVHYTKMNALRDFPIEDMLALLAAALAKQRIRLTECLLKGCWVGPIKLPLFLVTFTLVHPPQLGICGNKSRDKAGSSSPKHLSSMEARRTEVINSSFECSEEDGSMVYCRFSTLLCVSCHDVQGGTFHGSLRERQIS